MQSGLTSHKGGKQHGVVHKDEIPEIHVHFFQHMEDLFLRDDYSSSSFLQVSSFNSEILTISFNS